MMDFEEYIRQGEPSRAERAQAWRTAIGLQDVDGLRPSAYLIDTAREHIARFISNLWQIHPFGEGNTRTTAVFLIKYLRSFGFNVGNDAFERHSWFFRNALVRANYNDLKNGITATTEPLERFLRHLLLNEEADLRNRTLHIKVDGPKVRNEPLNNLTEKASLTEIAVLQLIAENPSVKIEDMAANTKKSRSTIKRAIDRLREKGIIERTGAKKNGSWKILNGNEH